MGRKPLRFHRGFEVAVPGRLSHRQGGGRVRAQV